MLGKVTSLSNCDRDYLSTKLSRKSGEHDAFVSWRDEWGNDEDYLEEEWDDDDEYR